jgi:hypothetical protein
VVALTLSIQLKVWGDFEWLACFTTIGAHLVNLMVVLDALVAPKSTIV